jgi:hypothetical protein
VLQVGIVLPVRLLHEKYILVVHSKEIRRVFIMLSEK